jgi:NAD(P)-dependent dehydrogenase (short-subunit alcohol dehydrogenase family)
MTHSTHSPLGGLRVAITGGTSGLGLALVEALRARGAEVAFVARHADGVARVADRYPGTHAIVGDVSRKDEIHPLALRITAALGGLDVLVNNASSLGPVPPYAGWGAYGTSKAALLHMSRIWNEELAGHGIGVQALDPGDMDTPLHALAVPDADPATLKRPDESAGEMIELIEAYAGERSRTSESRRHADPTPA